MRWICKEEEVEEFLSNIKRLLASEKWMDNLIIVKENKEGDKTQKFRSEKNITHSIVARELLKLDITNYSYTDYDDNPRFKNEVVWIFGTVYGTEEIYIKLKIREKVICLSFHEAEYELNYPYLN
ncbi:hypothetical protein [Neomoorella thermoacetica]|uniref:hypothetical protein n=1 Tax=Neomoorella thermoacetica TaxID=1525 RepID=UPI0008FAA9A0|nr:hypothetical protein [Moorella thermoacetica]OIQ11566.1 hypothetical protein MOOTH_15520 [Moorella thermoacetica]